jgi:hypothetical protein
MRTGNCQRWPTRHAIADRAVNLGPCEVEDNGPAWDNRRSGGPWPTHDRIRADCLTKRAKTAGLAGSVRSSYLRAVRVFVNALERLNYGVDSPLSDAGIRRGSLLTSLPWAQCRWFESSRPAHARARGTDWSLLGVPHLQELPAVRWTLQNLEQLSRSQPDRFRALAESLAARLAEIST